MDDMNARRSPVHGAWGLAVLAIFAGGAVLWRVAHRVGPKGDPAAARVPVASSIVSDAAVGPVDPGVMPTLPPAVPGSADAPRRDPVSHAARPAEPPPRGAIAPAVPGRDEDAAGPAGGARAPVPGSERWLRGQIRAQAGADPGGFVAEAKARLAAEAPLAEKVALLQAAHDVDPALANSLYAEALDPARTRDAALREAAAGLLLRDLRRPRPAPETWTRLSAFALGPGRIVDPLRVRLAGPLFAGAPEGALGAMAIAAEQDPDPAFTREAWRGLMRNGSPDARTLANGIARRRGWNPEEAQIADSGAAVAGE
jgi:hypothetical protein